MRCLKGWSTVTRVAPSSLFFGSAWSRRRFFYRDSDPGYYFPNLYDLNKSNTTYLAWCLNRVCPLSLTVQLAVQYVSVILYLLCLRNLTNTKKQHNQFKYQTYWSHNSTLTIRTSISLVEKFLVLKGSFSNLSIISGNDVHGTYSHLKWEFLSWNGNAYMGLPRKICCAHKKNRAFCTQYFLNQ